MTASPSEQQAFTVHSLDPVDLKAKVAFLRLASSYPEQTRRVEAIETHMSWVFLLDHHVYKLKKPVCLDEFDCRSLARRKHLCEEELRLNRRLAPHLYLDVVPLTFGERHGLAVRGAGRAVDWLVRMRRLAADKMLDHAILHGSVAHGDAMRLASRLVRFYLSLQPETIDPESYAALLRRRIEIDRRELLSATYRLPAEQVLALCDMQFRMLDKLSGLLAARVRGRRIVEGHGDLRPEHIYLGEEVVIIDCLEFSRELRTLDIADELGFLALECERLGAPAFGAELLCAYSALSGDAPAPQLVHFYQSCRARSRARIAVRHLLDEEHRNCPKWTARAGHYLALAGRHLAHCR